MDAIDEVIALIRRSDVVVLASLVRRRYGGARTAGGTGADEETAGLESFRWDSGRDRLTRVGTPPRVPGGTGRPGPPPTNGDRAVPPSKGGTARSDASPAAGAQ